MADLGMSLEDLVKGNVSGLKKIDRDIDPDWIVFGRNWVIDNPTEEMKLVAKDLIKKGKAKGRISKNRIIFWIKKMKWEDAKQIINIFPEGRWELVIHEMVRLSSDPDKNYSIIVGAGKDGRPIKPLWKGVIPKKVKVGDDTLVMTAIFTGELFLVAVVWKDGYRLLKVGVDSFSGEIKVVDVDQETEWESRMVTVGWLKHSKPGLSYAL